MKLKVTVNGIPYSIEVEVEEEEQVAPTIVIGGAGGMNTPVATTASVRATAANAVTAQVAAYARAHIGYPYQVGTKGPDVFDCAGLVTAAFASAGVTVRHSMTAQAALGSYVSRENLRPGDLVIWGDPVSAVSIYIGNDTIVIGDGPAYGVRTVTVTERLKYRSFQGGRRYTG